MDAKNRPPKGMSRRKFLGLAGTVVGAGVLAACGATPTATPVPPTATKPPAPPTATTAPAAAPPTATTAPAAPTATKPPATAAPPTPTAAAAAQPTLTKFSGQLVVSISETVPNDTKPGGPAQLALVAAYKDKQPGVDVVFNPSPAGVAGGYAQWMTTQLSANPPQIDIYSGQYAGTYANTVNFEKYRSVFNPYSGKQWDQAFDFDRFKWVNGKGERYGLAQRQGAVFWFYNKDMFDKVGAKPPVTWTDFVDVCTKLKAANITPIVGNWIWQLNQWMSGVYFDQYHLDWVNTVRAHPGDWCFDPDFDGKFKYDPNDINIHAHYTYNSLRYWAGIRDKTLRFDTPAFAEMTDNLAKAWPKYVTGDMFTRSDDGYATLLQQQAAIQPSGMWQFKTITDDLQQLTPDRLKALKLDPSTQIKSFNWGIFNCPSMESPLVKCKAKDINGQANVYVSIVKKSQEQIDRAMDFIMFWYSAPGATVWYNTLLANGGTLGGPCDIKGLQDPPEFQKYWAMYTPHGNAELNQNNWEFFSNYESLTNTHVVNLMNAYKDALSGKTTGTDFGKWLQNYWTTNWNDILTLKNVKASDLNNPAKEPGT